MTTLQAKDRYQSRYAVTAEKDGIRMTLIGHWVDLAAYYAGSDGNAWAFQSRWTNMGPVEAFKERLAKGQVRGTLH
jgi:hypothetical protein